jgi:hypothetical protein
VDLVRIRLWEDLLGDVGDLLGERADDAVVHAPARLDLTLVARAVALGLAQGERDLPLLDREAAQQHVDRRAEHSYGEDDDHAATP